MKTKIFLLVLTSVLIETASAQIYRAGFGNFFVGPAYSMTPSLQNDLNSMGFLGSSVQLNKVTAMFGGAGYSIRSSGVVLGGNGFTYQASSKVSKGEVTYENGAGFFNMGYCLVNKKHQLGFPYLGVGWHGSKFKVFNATADEIFVIGKDTIARDEVAEFKKEGFAFEAGYALKYYFFDEKDNKEGKIFMTMVGVDAGVSVFPALENWKGSTEIMTMERPFAMVTYLRISLGFGSFREKQK